MRRGKKKKRKKYVEQARSGKFPGHEYLFLRRPIFHSTTTLHFSSTCNPVLAGYKRGEGIVRGGEKKSSLKRKSFVDEDSLYGHMSCPRSTSRPLEKILLDFLGKRRRRNRVEGVPFNYRRDARSSLG